MMQKTITWKGLAEDSEEQCRIIITDAAVTAHGDIIGTNEDDTFFSLRYAIELTPDWQVRSVMVQDALDAKRTIALQYDGKRWLDSEGNHIKDYDDAAFIDISRTPFTNTPPIKRLQFNGKKPHKITVLYIDAETFEVRVVQQLYSQVGNGTYTYHDVEAKDFTADLTVDDDGLVISYPGLFERA